MPKEKQLQKIWGNKKPDGKHEESVSQLLKKATGQTSPTHLFLDTILQNTTIYGLRPPRELLNNKFLLISINLSL